MDHGVKERIESAVGVLVGLPLIRISRAVEMAMFGFGRLVDGFTHRGEPAQYAELALHVQGTWRLVGPEGRVVVGAREVFYPPGDPDAEPEGFDWDTQTNRFDEKAAQLRDELLPVEVVAVQASNAGDLILSLGSGHSLEVLIDHALPFEHWRFFGADTSGGHLVVTPAGIEDDEPAP